MSSKDDFSDNGTRLIELSEPQPGATSAYRVSVESGPDLGKTVLVDGSTPSDVLLGTSPACDLRLDDRAVSRRHASFDILAGHLRVRDLGSTNGTFVAGVRVTEALASSGNAIRVGTTTLRVSEGNGRPVTLSTEATFYGVLGTSREMRRLFPLLAKLAVASIPVLVEGETGTGKEAVAIALHAASARASKPFVLFDCTAITPNLVESELFGHERGAFTGATAHRRGVFEQADGGTLFIDELGELPLDLQAKLLRAIDTGQLRRVGAEKWLSCDVRVIAATRRNIEAMVERDAFRDDLFHRLAVGRVALPPLRERRADIPLLVQHFCQALGVSPAILSRATQEAWMTEAWPGNVRELRNAVARQVALGELAELEPLEARISRRPGTPATVGQTAGQELDTLIQSLEPYEESRRRAIEIFQQHYLEQAMRVSQNNVQRAANAAGMALRYFQTLRARFRNP